MGKIGCSGLYVGDEILILGILWRLYNFSCVKGVDGSSTAQYGSSTAQYGSSTAQY